MPHRDLEPATVSQIGFARKKKDVGEVISTPAGPTADELWGNAYFSVPSRHGVAIMIGGRQTLVRDDTFGSDV